MCTQLEGIIPGTPSLRHHIDSCNNVDTKALESAHAVWEAVRLAKTLPRDQDIVLVGPLLFRSVAQVFNILSFQCLSGRGDKDVEQISQLLPGKWADILDWHVSSGSSK